METILLTGSTGCLGSYVLEELAKLDEDINVKLLQRNPDKFENLLPQLELQDLDYETIEGDLEDFDLVQKIAAEVDTIFHVAAVFDFKSKWERFEKINVEGTKKMLSAMQPGCKFILTSSDGIYGFPNLDRGLREDEKRDPQSLYHKSKLQQENVTRQICEEKDIQYVIIRPTNIVGPRDSMTIPRLANGIKNRSVMLIRGGEHEVSLVHPQDVAYGHILGYQNIDKVNGEAFHLASINVSWKEYLATLSEELDEEPITRSVPYFIAYAFGWLADMMPFDSVYSRFNVKFAGTNHVLDYSKAEEMLNYQPKHNLEDIAESGIEWYNNFYTQEE